MNHLSILLNLALIVLESVSHHVESWEPGMELASSCYYLHEYQEAKKAFQDSVEILEKIPKEYLLKWNIEGNVALAMMRMGNAREGKSLFNESIEKIKREEGERSYDYACLVREYGVIRK